MTAHANLHPAPAVVQPADHQMSSNCARLGVSRGGSLITASRTGSLFNVNRRRPGAGRPSKGDRWLVYARLPRELADLFQAEADRLGLTYNDLLTNLAAEHYGHPPVQLPLAFSDDEQLSLSA